MEVQYSIFFLILCMLEILSDKKSSTNVFPKAHLQVIWIILPSSMTQVPLVTFFIMWKDKEENLLSNGKVFNISNGKVFSIKKKWQILKEP